MAWLRCFSLHRPIQYTTTARKDFIRKKSNLHLFPKHFLDPGVIFPQTLFLRTGLSCFKRGRKKTYIQPRSLSQVQVVEHFRKSQHVLTKTNNLSFVPVFVENWTGLGPSILPFTRYRYHFSVARYQNMFLVVVNSLTINWLWVLFGIVSWVL